MQAVPYNHKRIPTIFVRKHNLCGKVQTVPYARYEDGTEVILHAFFAKSFGNHFAHDTLLSNIAKICETVYINDFTYQDLPEDYELNIRRGALKSIKPSCTTQALDLYRRHVLKCIECADKRSLAPIPEVKAMPIPEVKVPSAPLDANVIHVGSLAAHTFAQKILSAKISKPAVAASNHPRFGMVSSVGPLPVSAESSHRSKRKHAEILTWTSAPAAKRARIDPL